MFRSFTFQNPMIILDYLHNIRGVEPINFYHYRFKQGTLDYIAVVEFLTVDDGNYSYIVDTLDYFNWIKVKERKLKINKLKKLI